MNNLTTRQLASKTRRQPRRRQGLLQAGSMLQDRYQILDTLGVGGFSSVYQARDMHFPTVSRLCAVKEMVHANRDPKAQELATSSFVREANILATLDHPAVPDVYDYFTEGDRSYLVLEYIHGNDLEALMTEQANLIKPEVVIDWTLQICDVLDYLHNHTPQPIVFRDLKPSNIMLDRHNRIRLIDFNIAKLFSTGIKGTMIGTEGYSPPEQYRGEASPAGDIYALGATLHHLLTGQDPRTQPPFSFAERPVHSLNPTVPPELEAIIDRCLAYEASDRFQKASHLRQELLQLVGSPNTGVPVSNYTYSPEREKVPQRGIAPTVAGRSPMDESPTPLWKFRCEDEIRSKAIVNEGIVYTGSYDSNLYALRASNGEFIWKHPASESIASTPSIFGDSVLFSSVDGFVYSIHKKTGKLNWRYETGGAIYSSPVADFNHVFVGSDDGYLYAINASNGRRVWQAKAHSMVRSTPCIGDDCVYFGTEAGYVFCVDLAGRIKWQFQAKRSITASPILAEDFILVGSMDSTVYGIDANSGWALWRYRTRRPVVSTGVVEADKLFIGSSDGNLYALDVYSGRLMWQYGAEGQINSSPAIWENAIYFGATDGSVYSLGIKRGKHRWRFISSGIVVASPVVEAGVVYVGSCDHYLYALPA